MKLDENMKKEKVRCYVARQLCLLLAGITVLLFSGCDPADHEKVFEISNGQSESQVVAILGEPSGRMVEGDRVILLYYGATLALQDGKTVGVDSRFSDCYLASKKTNQSTGSYLSKLKLMLKK